MSNDKYVWYNLNMKNTIQKISIIKRTIYSTILYISSSFFLIWFYVIFSSEYFFDYQNDLGKFYFFMFLFLLIVFIIYIYYKNQNNEEPDLIKKIIITCGSIVCVIFFPLSSILILLKINIFFISGFITLYKTANLFFNVIAIGMMYILLIPLLISFLIHKLWGSQASKKIQFDTLFILLALGFSLFIGPITIPFIIDWIIKYKIVQYFFSVVTAISLFSLHTSYLLSSVTDSNKLSKKSKI